MKKRAILFAMGSLFLFGCQNQKGTGPTPAKAEDVLPKSTGIGDMLMENYKTNPAIQNIKRAKAPADVYRYMEDYLEMEGVYGEKTSSIKISFLKDKASAKRVKEYYTDFYKKKYAKAKEVDKGNFWNLSDDEIPVTVALSYSPVPMPEDSSASSSSDGEKQVAYIFVLEEYPMTLSDSIKAAQSVSEPQSGESASEKESVPAEESTEN